jgi:predicted metalloprotease
MGSLWSYQVAEMQRVVEATGKTLPELWLELQPEILRQARAVEALEAGGEARKPNAQVYVKLNEVEP